MKAAFPVGGYFELELDDGGEYHTSGIRFNLGRSCLEFLLRCSPPEVVYIPYYTCSAVLEPIKKLGLDCRFYSLNANLEVDLLHPISPNSRILYTNYFGLKSRYVESLCSRFKNSLIVDNAQAFYSLPPTGIDAFYSCRKFFGVPDGAYLYSSSGRIEDYSELALDTSVERMDYLLRRIEFGAREGYQSFRRVEDSFQSVGMRRMSKLSERLMRSIRYSQVAEIRKLNYSRLHDALSRFNELGILPDVGEVPLAYPFLIDKPGLRERLIENDIFVPLYWENVLKDAAQHQWEYYLASRLCPLPIDQRLNIEDLDKIAGVVKSFLNEK